MEFLIPILGNALSHAFAFVVEWISFIGSGGLILLGIALILYSAVAVGLTKLFAVPAGIISITAGLYLAFITYGASEHAAGVAEERGRWEAAAAAERQRQADVKSAVESFAGQVVAGLNDRIAQIEPNLKGLLDEAGKEDAKPVPDDCRDVYRGLPPGVLRQLESIGR